MLKRTGLYAESWNVAWRRKAKGSILKDQQTPFVVIPNSFRYWAADPFFFEHNGDTYIFAELYDYVLCHGTLGYCKLQDNKVTKWKKVIQEPYHLSYPCIREYGDSIYIMPESGADKSLYIYKAVDFPDHWEKQKVLRDNVVYGDTTPFLHKDHPWALTYDVKDEYKLLLIDLKNQKEDTLIGDGNPKLQRPAGSLFLADDVLMRPAQICEHDYGEGLVFYQIQFDDDQNYKETEIKRLAPNDLVLSGNLIRDGIHTYNATDNYEVIDIKTRRFNILNFMFRILGKIRR